VNRATLLILLGVAGVAGLALLSHRQPILELPDQREGFDLHGARVNHPETLSSEQLSAMGQGDEVWVAMVYGPEERAADDPLGDEETLLVLPAELTEHGWKVRTPIWGEIHYMVTVDADGEIDHGKYAGMLFPADFAGELAREQFVST
jgi:hypothetical protein